MTMPIMMKVSTFVFRVTKTGKVAFSAEKVLFGRIFLYLPSETLNTFCNILKFKTYETNKSKMVCHAAGSSDGGGCILQENRRTCRPGRTERRTGYQGR